MEVTKQILLVHPLFSYDNGQRITLVRTLITEEFKIQDALHNTNKAPPWSSWPVLFPNTLKHHSYFGVQSQHLSPVADHLCLFSPFFLIRQRLT